MPRPKPRAVADDRPSDLLLIREHVHDHPDPLALPGIEPMTQIGAFIQGYPGMNSDDTQFYAAKLRRHLNQFAHRYGYKTPTEHELIIKPEDNEHGVPTIGVKAWTREVTLAEAS